MPYMPTQSTNHLIDNKGLSDKIDKTGSNSKTNFIDLKTKGLCGDLAEGKIKRILIRCSQMVSDSLTKAANLSLVSCLVSHVC